MSGDDSLHPTITDGQAKILQDDTYVGAVSRLEAQVAALDEHLGLAIRDLPWIVQRILYVWILAHLALDVIRLQREKRKRLVNARR